jgi:hypothetical protein
MRNSLMNGRCAHVWLLCLEKKRCRAIALNAIVQRFCVHSESQTVLRPYKLQGAIDGAAPSSVNNPAPGNGRAVHLAAGIRRLKH